MYMSYIILYTCSNSCMRYKYKIFHLETNTHKVYWRYSPISINILYYANIEIARHLPFSVFNVLVLVMVPLAHSKELSIPSPCDGDSGCPSGGTCQLIVDHNG